MAKKPLSQAEIFGILRGVGVGRRKARILVPIAKRESGGRYWINNAGLNKDGSVDHGLFQINDVWRGDPDIQRIGWGKRYDPVANAEMAKVVLQKQGLKAWATYTGMDDKYIGPAAKGYQGGANPMAAALRQRVGGQTNIDFQPASFGQSTQVDQAGYEKARKQAVLGAFLAQRRPNSILSRLLPQQMPNIADFTTTAENFNPAQINMTTGSGRQPTTPVGAGRSVVAGAEAAVQWATSKYRKGIAESGGANRGPWVDKLNARFGMTGQPWCAMFTSLAAEKGGAHITPTPRVADLQAWAAQGSHGYRRVNDPRAGRPGDMIAFGADHVTLIKKRTKNGYITIGGNESDRVSKNLRGFGEGTIIRPAYR